MKNVVKRSEAEPSARSKSSSTMPITNEKLDELLETARHDDDDNDVVDEDLEVEIWSEEPADDATATTSHPNVVRRPTD